MALAQVGGGYQLGDGNVNEIRLGYSAAPQTATSTATNCNSVYLETTCNVYISVNLKLSSA